MKRFARWVCFLLVLVTLFSTTAFAADSNTRASNFFAAHRVYLWEASSTELEAWFEVTAVGQMDELGTSYIEIQQSRDKVNWTTVATYYKEDNSQMIDTGTAHHSDCVSYDYTSGYYYRAYVTLYAKKGNSTGEYSAYTPIMDLR